MNEQAKIKGLKQFFQQNPSKENLSIINVISMDQPSQTGVKFEAFIKQLNSIHKKRRVKNIIIILTDFLQRHYIALNKKLSFYEIRKLSNEKGREWIRKNRKSLTFHLNLEINFVIIRWEKLYSRNDFLVSLNMVENLYQNDDKFRSIVNKLSAYFSNKLFLKSNGEHLNFQIYFDAAKNYLLEESAIWGPLFNMGLDFITYPGRKNEAVDYTYTKLFKSKNYSIPWFRYSFEKKHTSMSICSTILKKKYKSLDLLSSFEFFNFSTEKAESFKQQKEFNSVRRHSV